VVYCKPPFGGPEYVLLYLGRYTHRVAISNHRLVSFADQKVTFRWRDSAHTLLAFARRRSATADRTTIFHRRITLSSALSQVWRSDGCRRKTDCRPDPTPFSPTPGYGCCMKPLFTNSQTLPVLATLCLTCALWLLRDPCSPMSNAPVPRGFYGSQLPGTYFPRLCFRAPPRCASALHRPPIEYP
jgi:Putative transposase